MAIKVGNKMVGENPEEQLRLEKERFRKRQEYRKNKLEKKARGRT